MAGALAGAVAVSQDALALLAKLAAGFRADLELHYTGDQTGFLGYLTAREMPSTYSRRFPTVTLTSLWPQKYLECLRGFLTDARDHGSGMVLEVA